MILVIGLGNPDKKYAGTRHNVGREIAAAFGASQDLDEFRFDPIRSPVRKRTGRRPWRLTSHGVEKKWNALVSEGKIGKEKIALILPETMMNKSGAAAGAASRFYKIKPKDIFVIHDDADIALGATKLSFGKRSAGHKGVESVIRALKTKDFWRLRIGIAGRPRTISAGAVRGARHIPAEKLVLKKFTPEEQKQIKKITKRTHEALTIITAEGAARAMNEYNKN